MTNAMSAFPSSPVWSVTNNNYTTFTQDSLTTLPSSPRTPQTVKLAKDDRILNIKNHLVYAEQKYKEVLHKVAIIPAHNITPKMEDDVWAWEIFSQTVLPMLSFLDD